MAQIVENCHILRFYFNGLEIVDKLLSENVDYIKTNKFPKDVYWVFQEKLETAYHLRALPPSDSDISIRL